MDPLRRDFFLSSKGPNIPAPLNEAEMLSADTGFHSSHGHHLSGTKGVSKSPPLLQILEPDIPSATFSDG